MSRRHLPFKVDAKEIQSSTAFHVHVEETGRGIPIVTYDNPLMNDVMTHERALDQTLAGFRGPLAVR